MHWEILFWEGTQKLHQGSWPIDQSIKKAIIITILSVMGELNILQGPIAISCKWSLIVTEFYVICHHKYKEKGEKILLQNKKW